MISEKIDWQRKFNIVSIMDDFGRDELCSLRTSPAVAGGSALNKKLSYRRETARQLPTWRREVLQPTPYAPSGAIYVYGRIRNPQQTYVNRTVH